MVTLAFVCCTNDGLMISEGAGVSLKDWLLGGLAYKAYKQGVRPGVTEPPGFTVVGLEHIGLGSEWRVSYIRDESPNVRMNFRISPGTTQVHIGSNTFNIYWP